MSTSEKDDLDDAIRRVGELLDRSIEAFAADQPAIGHEYLREANETARRYLLDRL